MGGRADTPERQKNYGVKNQRVRGRDPSPKGRGGKGKSSRKYTRREVTTRKQAPALLKKEKKRQSASRTKCCLKPGCSFRLTKRGLSRRRHWRMKQGTPVVYLYECVSLRRAWAGGAKCDLGNGHSVSRDCRLRRGFAGSMPYVKRSVES